MTYAVVAAVTLVLLGVPIGLSLMGATLVGFALAYPVQLNAVITTAINSVHDSTFTAIPLFVVGGAVVAESGFMESLLDILSVLLRPIRGGLTIACLGTGLFFAGATGSSAGEAASLSSSFFEPMRRRGYDSSLTAAVICAAAAAGVLIPPSITLIIYGTIASYPITQLWLAGVVPALISGAAIGIVAVILARTSQGITIEQSALSSPPTPRRLALRTFVEAVCAMGLPTIVLGGIYGGIFTVTETAAVAIAYVIAFGVVFKGLRVKRILSSLGLGAQRAGMIFLIFIGAHVFTYYLTLSGVTTSLVERVTSSGLSRPVLLLALDIAILVLGSAMDGLSVLIVATPLLYPLLGPLGLSPVQLGVMICFAIEIGVIHPPIGLNLFAVSSVTGVPVARIAIRILPFIAVLLAMLFLVTYTALPIFAWHK